jgi:hypothetical protein
MVTSEHRIVFRVGINLGDMVAEDDRLPGNGINVAARLARTTLPSRRRPSRARPMTIINAFAPTFDRWS